MELDLIDSWNNLGTVSDRSRDAAGKFSYLAGWVIEELLQIPDTKVGDTDVPDLSSGRKLLHLLPCLDEIPVWVMLAQVVRVCRGWPVHKVEVDIVSTQGFQ